MRRNLVILMFLSLTGSIFADDLLMLRSGQEIVGKLDVVSDKEIIFNPEERSTPNRYATDDVYMVKTEKRGTIFYNPAREKLMLGSVKNKRKASYIYLVNGGEIEAWDIRMSNGVINYKKNPKEEATASNIGMLAKEQIFLIKYPDGSKDLLTDISGNFKARKEVNKEKKTKIKVIMAVVNNANRSLQDLANQYEVTVEQIVEWNDFPKTSTGKTRLPIGTQVMIQKEEEIDE